MNQADQNLHWDLQIANFTIADLEQKIKTKQTEILYWQAHYNRARADNIRLRNKIRELRALLEAKVAASSHKKRGGRRVNPKNDK